MSVNPRCVKGGSVSSQMCRQKAGKGPTVPNPWALPAFHSRLAEEDTPKGECRGPLGAAVCSREPGIEFPATSRLPRVVISDIAKGRDEL